MNDCCIWQEHFVGNKNNPIFDSMFEAHTQVTIYFTLLSIFVLFFSILIAEKPETTSKYSSAITTLLLIFCVLFIGWRDWRVQEVFVDSVRYGQAYLTFDHSSSEDVKDIGFYTLQYLCKSIGISVELFFVVCALLYLIPKIKTVKELSPRYSFILLLAMMTSLGFYSYGVNAVRAGIATSFMLLSFVKYKKIRTFCIYAVLAVLFHKSVVLPLAAFICARIYNKDIKRYIFIWLFAVPLSFVVKGLVSDFILGFDFLNDRAEGYLIGEADASMFSHVGFRYDFVMFSTVPLLVGWYFIVKKKFDDNFYRIIFCTYSLANAAWILINSVPFSDRFAYLSWFMMPIIIFYPFLYCSNVKRRFSKIAMILIAQLCFTLII